jgi:tight adherence protein C
MSSSLFAAVALMLAVAATFLFGLAFFPDEQYVGPMATRGYLSNKRTSLMARSPAYRLLLKVLMVFAFWAEKLPIDGLRKAIDERLARAGQLGGFTADEYLAFTMVSALSFFSLAFFFNTSVTGAPRIPLCMVAAMFGGYFPVMYLDEQVMTRLTSINRDLPYLLDVLALSVGAGLDFNSSLERVVNKDSTGSPLVEEMRYVLQEVKMGTTRRDALIGLKDRIPSDYIAGLVSSVVQAEQMGTPLTNILRIQAGAIRLKRSQRAEKLAGEAPVKMIMPLLFIVGAVMLTLFGSILIRAIRGELF